MSKALTFLLHTTRCGGPDESWMNLKCSCITHFTSSLHGVYITALKPTQNWSILSGWPIDCRCNLDVFLTASASGAGNKQQTTASDSQIYAYIFWLLAFEQQRHVLASRCNNNAECYVRNGCAHCAKYTLHSHCCCSDPKIWREYGNMKEYGRAEAAPWDVRDVGLS